MCYNFFSIYIFPLLDTANFNIPAAVPLISSHVIIVKRILISIVNLLVHVRIPQLHRPSHHPLPAPRTGPVPAPEAIRLRAGGCLALQFKRFSERDPIPYRFAIAAALAAGAYAIDAGPVDIKDTYDVRVGKGGIDGGTIGGVERYGGAADKLALLEVVVGAQDDHALAKAIAVRVGKIRHFGPGHAQRMLAVNLGRHSDAQVLVMVWIAQGVASLRREGYRGAEGGEEGGDEDGEGRKG